MQHIFSTESTHAAVTATAILMHNNFSLFHDSLSDFHSSFYFIKFFSVVIFLFFFPSMLPQIHPKHLMKEIHWAQRACKTAIWKASTEKKQYFTAPKIERKQIAMTREMERFKIVFPLWSLFWENSSQSALAAHSAPGFFFFSFVCSQTLCSSTSSYH